MTPLESACEWAAADMADPAVWTYALSTADIEEVAAAVAHAQARSRDFLEIGAAEFPLPGLAPRLKRIEAELINGRGFAVIRGLDPQRFDRDALCLAYWGIGAHLGRPWPQNHKGHLLGDVTDQGKAPDDPTARGNELGQIGLELHCDGSDLVGLLCLAQGARGGASLVCNSVALHNVLVRERPDLAAELYKPQPYDMRGEQAPGARSWYELPVFTHHAGRLFVRLIGAYIHASQRHADAPRLTPRAIEALAWMKAAADSGRWTVVMDFQPGDMQFINNYHVLHGRLPYEDDRAAGKVRHLKRLWLETRTLTDRPAYFRNNLSGHWARNKVISRLDAA
ncbi:MAG: TauD/TfdA family dioxygenase [Alphaproteobacteria bacterium]|nr:TauD/TfdA family dioxygenase [Alphaproteobacteria bacterium]